MVDYIITTIQVITRFEPGELSKETYDEDDARSLIFSDLKTGNYEIIKITELRQPELPDLKDICMHATKSPCNGCIRGEECNEHHMPDVGMMQE